jgi:DNA-binding PadR family transcriptional regulator
MQIPLTMPTLLVLRALLTEPTVAKYGLEIIRASGKPPGTVYPILHRLESLGWVTSVREVSAADRARRRYYQLTPTGRARAENILAQARMRLIDSL